MFPVIDGVQIGTDYKDIICVGRLPRQTAAKIQNAARSHAGQLTFIDLYDKAAAYISECTTNNARRVVPYAARTMIKALTNLPLKHPLIKPGQMWASQNYVMAVHEGDWHNAVDDFYRPWYDSEMPEPENPQWLVEDYSGMVQMAMLNFNAEQAS